MSARPVGTWFLVVAGVAVAGAVVAAMLVIGSPGRQRAQRFDERRVADLQALRTAVDGYARNEKRLPADLAQLQKASPDEALDVEDPETGARYEYRVVDARRYALCARFALARTKRDLRRGFDADERLHPAGRHCFEYALPAKGVSPNDAEALTPLSTRVPSTGG